MMKKLLREWRNFLNEDASHIEYKTGKLIDLLKEYPKIKRLRVPSWSLQDVYYRYTNPSFYDQDEEKSVATIALDNGKPVGIAAVVKDYDCNIPQFSTGCVNLFVDSWHRDMGIASQLFIRTMEVSGYFKYLIGSRRTKEILEKRGYVTTNRDCDYIGCSVFENKHYSRT